MILKVLLFILLIIFVLIMAIRAIYKWNKNAANPSLWSANIESLTKENPFWRDVLHTSDNLQVVAMSVPAGQELGREVHTQNDQFFRIESGMGRLVANVKGIDQNVELRDGVAVVVPRGIHHNVINTGTEPLKMYTIYGPPHHPPGTRDRTLQDELSRT